MGNAPHIGCRRSGRCGDPWNGDPIARAVSASRTLAGMPETDGLPAGPGARAADDVDAERADAMLPTVDEPSERHVSGPATLRPPGRGIPSVRVGADGGGWGREAGWAGWVCRGGGVAGGGWRWGGFGGSHRAPLLCRARELRRASEQRPMRARRRRERSDGSHSRRCMRSAPAFPTPRRERPAAAVRQSARWSPRAPQPPTAAHATLPRRSRDRPAPLAPPPERRRRDGWPSPPRRDRSRDRRARCPARESLACGRTSGHRAHGDRHAAFGARPMFPRGHARGRVHRLGHELAVRAQAAAAARSAAAVSSSEASSRACLSCDGPAAIAAPGHAAAARAYRCEMLSCEITGRDQAVRGGNGSCD